MENTLVNTSTTSTDTNQISKPPIRTILTLLLIVILAFISFFIYHSYKNKIDKLTETDKLTWHTSEKTYDIVTAKGNLIKIEDNRGGITILPPNHQAQPKQITATKFDIVNQSESQLTLLTSATDTTRVTLLQNPNNPDNLWIMAFDRINDCENDKTGNGFKSCNLQIIDFDTNVGKHISSQDISFHPNAPDDSLHSLKLLAFDPKNEKLWIAINVTNPATQFDYFSPSLNKEVSGIKDSYTTRLLTYNTKTQETDFITLNRGVNFNNRVWNYDLDGDGNLYIITDCIFSDCTLEDKNNMYFGGSVIYKVESMPSNPRIYPLNYFDYDMDKNFLEFTIAKDNQTMYLANHTWSSLPNSWILKNDLNRQVSTQIGVPDMERSDDIRGIVAKANKLFIGTFNGLGIYSDFDNTWRFLTTNNGLKSNNVENLSLFENGICVGHESEGTSCYYGQISDLRN